MNLSILFITGLIIFFFVYFGFTQKIYSKNYIKQAILISLIVPAISYFMTKEPVQKKLLAFELVFFTYLVLLFFTKLVYKRLNNFLVEKLFINTSFRNKDFTFAWISEGNDAMWNEKLAAAPSWLDYFISGILILLPLLSITFFTPFYKHFCFTLTA